MNKNEKIIIDLLLEEPRKTIIVGFYERPKYTAQELAKIIDSTVNSIYRYISSLKRQGYKITTLKHTRETYETTGNVEYLIDE